MCESVPEGLTFYVDGRFQPSLPGLWANPRCLPSNKLLGYYQASLPGRKMMPYQSHGFRFIVVRRQPRRGALILARC